eukprot:4591922-Pyramimonas_sp.AAC.1
MLRELGAAKLEPSAIIYSAGISACEKGGQWQQSLLLLREALELKLEADVALYSAGVSACEKGA